MRTHTATIELDDDQTSLIEATASFFGSPLEAFLSDCLASGLTHAVEEMRRQGRAGATQEARRARPGYSDMDDDIPF